MEVSGVKTGYPNELGYNLNASSKAAGTDQEGKTESHQEVVGDQENSDQNHRDQGNRDQVYISSTMDEYGSVSPQASSIGSGSGSGDFSIPVGNSSFQTAASYARLAGASSKPQVQTVLGEAYQSMASLRLVASLGDNLQQRKARTTIASLQKLVWRGKRKIRKLDEETLLNIRKKRAEKKREKKKVKQYQIELKKKQILRRAADRGLKMEGALTDVNNAYRFHREDREHEERIYGMDGMGGTISPGADMSAGDSMAEPVVTGGEIVE